jgi:hypothetical protein
LTSAEAFLTPNIDCILAAVRVLYEPVLLRYERTLVFADIVKLHNLNESLSKKEL